MKHIFRNLMLLATVCCAPVVTACDDDDVDTSISVIKDDQTPQNDLDKWLLKNFVEPYNVQMRYRWEDNEISMDYILVPARYECSVKMANAIKYICFEAFRETTGSTDFIRKHFPKMIQLVGNPGWNANHDGSYTLGSAEGGYRIDLWYVNKIKDAQYDIATLNANYFHVIFHEFGHVFHQKVPYPAQYNQITGTGYRGAMWTAYTDNDAAQLDGFITAYASSSVDEDFAEVFSSYILMSQAEIDRMNEYSGAARNLINSKITIMKDYFKTNWNLDVDKLRERVQYREQHIDELNFDDLSL